MTGEPGPAGAPDLVVAYPDLIDQVLEDPGTVILLGAMDSGKTSFARTLLAAAVERGIPAAYLDTDLGRPMVGPPTTIGLKFVHSPEDLEPANLAKADGLYFVGWISAQFHLLPLITGTAKLMNVVRAETGFGGRAEGVRLVVVDTSSLIGGVYGQLLKYHKLEVVEPDLVIGFQRGEELEPLLGIARRFTPARVEARTIHADVHASNVLDRSSDRQARFAAYFAEPLHRWRVKPTVFLPSLPPGADVSSLGGLLVGMEDGKGVCVGLGLLEVGEDGGLRMLSSVSEGARALRLGGTRVTADWSSTTRVDLRHLFGTE
jgi:polynucleotide 5'-kinase involved in rRNA processing